MEKGYRNWQEGVKEDRGITGISLEENQETKNFAIATIDKGTPAEIAGMLPGDILITIDDSMIQEMTLEQAHQKLRGKPGTSVNITVRRGDRDLIFQLIRARFGVISPQRQAELVEALGFLADYHKSLVERLSTHLNKLTTLADQIADGKADPVQALLSISEDLGRENLQLQQETNTIIERGRELFKERREIIQESDFIFSAFQAITRNRNEIDNINLQELSAREERFARLIETDSQLSMAEKSLLQGYYTNVMVLMPLSFFLEEERNFIQKLDIKQQFEENRKRSEQMVSYLANWLEQWRTQLVNDLDKIDALDKGQPFFQNVMEFLIAQGNEKEALVTSEKSRARAFADLLTTRLSSNSETRTSAATPTIEQIQQIAKQENATLVEYAMISDRNLAIWVIQPTGEIVFHQVDIKSLNISLDRLVFDTRDSIGVRNSPPIVAVVPTQSRLQRQEAMLNQKLQQLHQILIEPIADLLPTNPEDRIIFMPQGELFLVPFPALKDTDGKYLIEKHTILTSPSIQVLQLTRTQKEKMANRERGETETALVIGNPTMPKVTREFGKPPEQLPSLPGAELEAKAIAPLLNTQPLIGNQATETTVVQKMPQARIIHFATHGLLDDIRGLGSAIALAPDLSSPSAPGGKDTANGLLTAEEILDLKLNAELVILSACNTGRGKITGDGVLGLSRSFISAGVPSIIVSLWSVPDAPTGSLMTEFYQNMSNNPDKAQALRQAILTTKAKYPNPKDWAAFTLIGEAK
ncbi:MAG TPA: hypothetical protein DD000_07100 [Cyanobacteria bacterium UBA11166]|nr:hypothetical protein [Cyanobacteria bacterium UBA11166]